MAYNGFPATYQPMYYQPQYQPTYQQQAQPQNNGIIWVQGEAGAKSYLVAPNTTVQLWDSESQSIYLKSADASGMPAMKILDYTIRDVAQNNGPIPASAPASPDYATRADLDALAGQLQTLRAEVNHMAAKAKEATVNE